MRNIIRVTPAVTIITALILAGCTQSPETAPQPAASTSQIVVNTQASTEEVSSKSNLYTSKEHHFLLEYPRSWKIIQNKNSIIISANDQDNEWGGTNLNLQYDFEVGDVGMGWKETKKSEVYVNPQGITFNLSFSGPDEDFDKQFDVKTDPDDRNIIIGTDAIPGLAMFEYNASVNPDGERQLRDILKTVRKTNS